MCYWIFFASIMTYSFYIIFISGISYSLFFYVYRPWQFWKLNCEASIFPKFFKQTEKIDLFLKVWKYPINGPKPRAILGQLFHLFHDYWGIIFLLPMNFIIFIFLKQFPFHPDGGLLSLFGSLLCLLYSLGFQSFYN